jgi:hypothetical protein
MVNKRRVMGALRSAFPATWNTPSPIPRIPVVSRHTTWIIILVVFLRLRRLGTCFIYISHLYTSDLHFHLQRYLFLLFISRSLLKKFRGVTLTLVTMSKPVIETDEDTFQANHAIDWAEKIAAYSPEERAAKEKALMRKIDWRLLPILVRPSPTGLSDSHQQ